MRTFALLLMLAFTWACQTKKQDEQTQEQPEDQTSETQNILTEQQASEGWTLLFDGKSMNGWRIYKGKPNDSWEVSRGTLHCKPFKDGATNERSDIITTGQYDNFELAFQWKISPQGNSGVIYRASEEFNEAYETGPEYQVLDDVGYPGKLTPLQLSAANYDMYVVENAQPKAVGEWNDGKIVIDGNRVEHWLNGVKVVEYELYSADWVVRKQASKWKDFPGYATVQKGHIALQDHGNEVWYRNIMIRDLN